MFNTRINFILVVRDNLPQMLQQSVTMQWIRAFTKPVREVYKQFQALSTEYLFRIRFNGQACYLQKILNLRFDPSLQRIHVIDTKEDRRYVYDYSAPPGKNRVYSKWDREYIYSPGQFAVDDGYLFEALLGSQNKKPKVSIEAGEGCWKYSDKKRFVIRFSKVGVLTRYIVYVPSSLVFDNNEFVAVLNYYRLAGLTYTIKPY